VATGTALAVVPFSYSQAPPPAVTQRGYSAGKLALELDGQFAGWLKSANGGHAFADVVTQGATVNGTQRKHLAGVKYEDIVLTCGTGMSPSLYEWIKASFDKQSIRRNGSLVACDYNYKAQSWQNWFNTSISEIAFPACDAASKEPGNFTISLTPEEIQWKKGVGEDLLGGRKPSTKESNWLPSNFRLSISGLDCSRVNKIEAITAATSVKQAPDSGMRQSLGAASSMQMSSLAVTLAETDAGGFFRWMQDSMAGRQTSSGPGNAGKSGVLEFLDPSLRETLFSLSFFGLGINQLVPEALSAHSEQIRRVKAVMSYKDLRFAYGAAASA
jgi:hypothetical protein